MTWIRTWKNFRENPSSLGYATAVIMSLSVFLVIVGATMIRIFDSSEYPTFGDAVWFTLQTVTTVGYGDNPPVTAVGRVVTSVVMLSSIGLITVITAVVTSLFIDSARNSRTKSRDDETAESLARIETSLAANQERLDRIEQQFAGQSSGTEDKA